MVNDDAGDGEGDQPDGQGPDHDGGVPDGVQNRAVPPVEVEQPYDHQVEQVAAEGVARREVRRVDQEYRAHAGPQLGERGGGREHDDPTKERPSPVFSATTSAERVRNCEATNIIAAVAPSWSQIRPRSIGLT